MYLKSQSSLYYVSEITEDIRNKKIILMEEKTDGTFWDHIQFLFLLFPIVKTKPGYESIA